MKKLLIADGTNIMFRSFYGVRPFTTKTGLHTNAVYGSATTLSRQIEEIKPDAVAVAFDLPKPTFRHEKYEAYKGTRKKAPDELTEQIPYVKRCINALGAHVIETEGYEADDILGTLAERGEAEGYEVYVLSGDRDILQLITDKTHVIYITSKGNVLYDEDVFMENYGTVPEKLVDIKALMGDSSDNIPGVPGIGEKTAKKLISEVGSLNEIYEDLESLAVTNSVREKLRAGRELAYLSAELATIRRDAPIEVGLDELEYRGIDKKELAELFGELEFYKLSERFGLTSGSANNANAENSGENGSENGNVSAEEADGGISKAVPLTENDIALLDGAAVVFCDGEIFIKADRIIYKAAPEDAVTRKFFEENGIVCYDFKSLITELRGYGIVPKCLFDTMLAAYVLRSGESSYALPRLLLTYLSENNAPTGGEETVSAVLRLAREERKIISAVDEEAEKLGEAKVSDLLYNIEIPLVPVLAEMEETGFCVDTDGLLKYSEMLRQTENALAEQIYFRAGHEFNINSPKQLGNVLFEELGLPAGRKTKTGYSTDAETLDGLRNYEIVEDILAYRQIAKLRGTYGEGLAAMADENGRIHTSFNQTVTATGRLSSTEPNLQNIPVRTELGRELRRFFIPTSCDRVLVDADYSQIELRLLAAISDDEAMKEAFLSGKDIHASTASEVFGVPMENVTKELRSRAKAVNFGIVYGIGEYSLSKDIGTSRKTAAEYIANYLSTYKGVDEYLKNTVSMAKERGYVTTLFGRRRYIPEINASNRQTKAFGERVAMNSPIQGTAADIIKLAMINVHKALAEENIDAKLILQVHDELIVEARREDAERVKEILCREMEGAATLSVPMSVESKVGGSWFECK